MFDILYECSKRFAIVLNDLKHLSDKCICTKCRLAYLKCVYLWSSNNLQRRQSRQIGDMPIRLITLRFAIVRKMGLNSSRA